jgi:hypothetical protein
MLNEVYLCCSSIRVAYHVSHAELNSYTMDADLKGNNKLISVLEEASSGESNALPCPLER